jgi:hypothetical protein
MSTNAATARQSRPTYVVCIANYGYETELVIGKVYRVHRPIKGDRPVELRVVDESGEDYLYPAKWFVKVEIPPKARRVLSRLPAAA